jgi:xanthine dehydrogenase accessory factor
VSFLAPHLRAALAAGEPAILVTVVRAEGSTPREAGAVMLVTLDASHGTIGGGQLEFHAIDVAREMIGSGTCERRLDLPLGPHLGQCCGGRVELLLRRAGDTELAALSEVEAREAISRPHALLFGAGHVGLALAQALALLPVTTTLIDDRDTPAPPLPDPVSFEQVDDPETLVAKAPAGAAFVILTHSHALDYRLADAALRRRDAAYVGMIGSATKRARFEHWFLARGGAREALSRFICPIGGKATRDKRPQVIAALAAAEIVGHVLAVAGVDVAPRRLKAAAISAPEAKFGAKSGAKLGRSNRAA